MYVLEKKCTIEIAHNLPDHPGKCRQLHGHSIQVLVRLHSRDLNSNGMVADFGDVKAVVEQYDHKCLNDFPAFEQQPPTSENLARVIAIQLREKFEVDRIEVSVQETENSVVTFDLTTLE